MRQREAVRSPIRGSSAARSRGLVRLTFTGLVLLAACGSNPDLLSDAGGRPDTGVDIQPDRNRSDGEGSAEPDATAPDGVDDGSVDGSPPTEPDAAADAPADTAPLTAGPCGDSILNVGEECDDGNKQDWDGCTRLCKIGRCGDGFVRLDGEQCDDSNTSDGDGCTADCQLPRAALVKLGGEGGCVIGKDGVARCWGKTRRAPTLTEPLVDVAFSTAASPGTQGPCGLTRSGTVVCWSVYGVPSAPIGTFTRLFSGSGCMGAYGVNSEIAWSTSIERPVGVSDPVGSFGCQYGEYDKHSCATRPNGDLVCAGTNSFGQSTPPTGTFAQTCVGSGYSCALRTDSTLTCWGYFPSGVSIDPGARFTELSCGEGHFCAIPMAGGVRCWSGSTPTAVVTTGTYHGVSAGYYGPCALDQDDKVTCFASPWNALAREAFIDVSDFGEPCFLRRDGRAFCLNQTAPIPFGPFTQLTSGGAFRCGLLANGSVQCWNGISTEVAGPPPGQYVQVTVGNGHGCARRSDNTLVCWGGANTYGESLAPEGTFEDVAAGYGASCGIATDGTVHCWGMPSVAQTPPAGKFRRLSVGWGTACAIAEDESISCWGLGDMTDLTPPAGKYVAVSTTSRCALRPDGQVVCWGNGNIGPPNQSAPIVKLGGGNCGVRSDGRPVCWVSYLYDGARPPY